ncbi:hypothetical protein BO71DRAFT_426413 [Aspergillus ellipticus CBS 707.79]|uniref:Uncharacterized protein n=1 Tax=Aspergillus ellipticus CBS 707.79 TaxID=1448320 RepID=A0A319F0R6_9EURO|nr:hypothetical protein BO71DRAFT_426413 [Aspergillus ellipticus CBS 707.79]
MALWGASSVRTVGDTGCPEIPCSTYPIVHQVTADPCPDKPDPSQDPRSTAGVVGFTRWPMGPLRAQVLPTAQALTPSPRPRATSPTLPGDAAPVASVGAQDIASPSAGFTPEARLRHSQLSSDETFS